MTTVAEQEKVQQESAAQDPGKMVFDARADHVRENLQSKVHRYRRIAELCSDRQSTRAKYHLDAARGLELILEDERGIVYHTRVQVRASLSGGKRIHGRTDMQAIMELIEGAIRPRYPHPWTCPAPV